MKDYNFEQDLDFVFEECCVCGVIFAFPEILKTQRLKNKESFHCPNGHENVYIGKTEEEKKIERLQSELSSSQKSKNYYQDSFYRNQDSISAYKGQITKLKNKLNK